VCFSDGPLGACKLRRSLKLWFGEVDGKSPSFHGLVGLHTRHALVFEWRFRVEAARLLICRPLETYECVDQVTCTLVENGMRETIQSCAFRLLMRVFDARLLLASVI
jgi:hypothetical protein